MATMARVLGHPARIAIIEYLLSSSACINSDLVVELGLAQPTISQHLRELKELGIIKGNIEGNKISYCIDRERWNQVKETFQEFFNREPLMGDSCC